MSDSQVSLLHVLTAAHAQRQKRHAQGPFSPAQIKVLEEIFTMLDAWLEVLADRINVCELALEAAGLLTPDLRAHLLEVIRDHRELDGLVHPENATSTLRRLASQILAGAAADA